MASLSRREILRLGLALPAGLSSSTVPAQQNGPFDVHQQILDLAASQESARRKRFAAVTTKEELTALQTDLRRRFLGLLDGFPPSGFAPTSAEARDDRGR